MKVLLFYKDFIKVNTQFCHVGLGVNAFHTERVLNRVGVECKAFGVVDSNQLDKYLNDNKDATFAVIEAPVWVWINKLDELTNKYPNIKFLVRTHSQLNFLAVEPSAIKAIRDIADLSRTRTNLSLASNSPHVKNWVEQVFDVNCVYLPNLYDLTIEATKHNHNKDRGLHIGSFGSLRVAKNHTSAAGAAQMLARKLGKDLFFHINVNRSEHGPEVLNALRNMFNGLPGMNLVEDEWSDWKNFRKLIGSMDLNFQVSTTETFNLVTADSLAEMVPVVGSPMIEWLPDNWKANIDDLEHMMAIGHNLIFNAQAKVEGLEALDIYTEKSIKKWIQYLHLYQY